MIFQQIDSLCLTMRLKAIYIHSLVHFVHTSPYTVNTVTERIRSQTEEGPVKPCSVKAFLVGVAIVGLMGLVRLTAQTTVVAQIAGIVTDSTGAVVAGGQVTATQTETRPSTRHRTKRCTHFSWYST